MFLLKIVGLILVAETIYLAIWTGIDHQKAVEISDPLNNGTTKLVCGSSSGLFSSLLIALDVSSEKRQNVKI